MEQATVDSADEVDRSPREVTRQRGSSPLVVDYRKRITIASRIGSGQDLGREVVARRPVQPGRADDPEPRRIPERGSSELLARELAETVRVARLRRFALAIAHQIRAPAVEHLVRGEVEKADASRGDSPRQVAGRFGVSPHRERRVPRAAVDVRPRSCMDHQRRSIAVQQGAGIGRVEVVVAGAATRSPLRRRCRRDRGRP